MAYCTEGDISKRLPETILIELTDDDGVDVVNLDVVDAAIADADEEVDAFLSMHYTLPFDTTPALVKRMSADLAVCNLYARRDHLELPKQWADRCGATRRMLEKMAAGKLRLDVPDPASSSDDGVETTTVKSDRVFSLGRSSDGSSGTLDNY